MNEQDYQQAYNEKALQDKLHRQSLSLSCDLIEKVLTLYYLLQDQKTTAWVKTSVVLALGYFISPIDAIPDAIPVIGYSDDLAIITALLSQIEDRITPAIETQAQKKLPDFCTDEHELELIR